MVNETERVYRRRLLATAMPEDVKLATLQKSLDILEKDFGSVETLKYSELVSRLQTNLDRAELNVGQLLSRILSLKGKSADDLGPDPGSNPGVSENTKKPARITGRLKVFNALFSSIAAEVDRRKDLASIKQQFEDAPASLGLSSATGDSVVAWCASAAANSEIQGPNEDLQKIVNHAFVWLCNEYGPIDADKILVRSVRTAESIPEAFSCSPKSFL